MRAVIHAGMQKTGSSSIQRTFSTLEVPGWYYPALIPTGNHSSAWITLFEDDPETAIGHALAGHDRGRHGTPARSVERRARGGARGG